MREAFPIIRLTLPNEVRPVHTQLLTEKVTAGQWPPPFLGKRVYQAPIRSVDMLMAAIAAGETDDFRMLEWLSALGRKASWDAEHPGQAKATADAVWDASVRHASLRRALYRKLCHHLTGKRSNLADSLLQGFARFRQRAPESQQLACRFLQALTPMDAAPSKLASLALDTNLAPERLRLATGMPSRLEAVAEAYAQVIRTWMSRRQAVPHAETWLIGCLADMDEFAEIEAVEQLLTTLPKAEVGQYGRLVGWLKERYAPQGDGLRRWGRLSLSAQHALRDWIGAVNFAVFESLVEQLLESEWTRLLSHEREIKQMRSRCVFWSNYSHRFARIRILLTKSAHSVLDLKALNTQEIGLLNEHDLRYNDYTQSTEVCIFDFEQWLVVEFFRGRGSETMVVPATAEMRQALFERQDLSVKRLRALGMVEGRLVLDHVFHWQYYSERELAKRQILPNDGLKAFKVMPGTKARPFPYKRKDGMPLPHDPDGNRESGYEGWRRTVNQLLTEARREYPPA